MRAPVAYIIVSGFCLILHTANLILADRIGIPLGFAVLLSFAVVACVGYFLHALFTFRQSIALSRLIRYAAAMSANIPFAYITIWILHVAARLPMAIAAPVASGFMLGMNFVLGRWAIAAPSMRIADPR